MLEHEALTGKIIGAAIEVHRQLGPGFLESIYENALVIALRQQGLKVDQQMAVSIYFAGHEVGEHRLDLLVEDLIVVELKAIKRLLDIHFSITRSYLKAVNREHGLLINFAKPILEVRRVIRKGSTYEETRNAGR